MSWKDEVLDATCPDLIMIVEADSGKGVYNWGSQLAEGKEVMVIGMSATEPWQTARGFEIFGPKHFGFDFQAKPLSAR